MKCEAVEMYKSSNKEVSRIQEPVLQFWTFLYGNQYGKGPELNYGKVQISHWLKYHPDDMVQVIMCMRISVD